MSIGIYCFELYSEFAESEFRILYWLTDAIRIKEGQTLNFHGSKDYDKKQRESHRPILLAEPIVKGV